MRRSFHLSFVYAFAAALLLWTLPQVAEASHFRGGNIIYENLGVCGAACTGVEQAWIVIKATMTISQRGSAHCSSVMSAAQGGTGVQTTTCCNAQTLPFQCKGDPTATPPRPNRWRGGFGSTWVWNNGVDALGNPVANSNKPHPTLSVANPAYEQPPLASQATNTFTVNNFEIIDENTTDDWVEARIVLYRIYDPRVSTTTITWSSCCWISGVNGLPPTGGGNFMLTTTAQVASGNRDPVFNSPLLINACVGQPFTQDLNPSDPDKDDFEVLLTATTGGADTQTPPLTLSRAGLVSWSAPKAGLWVVNATVYDLIKGTTTRRGASTFRQFLLNVTAVCANRPPVITFKTPATVTVTVGQQACVDVEVTDPDNNKLTLTISPTKAGATVTPLTALQPNQNSPLTFKYCWTPGAGDDGTTHNIQFTVRDDGSPSLSAQKTFAITVPAGNPPTITIAPVGNSKTVSEGQCNKFTATAADTDSSIDTFTATVPAFCTVRKLSATVIEVECCPTFTDGRAAEYDIVFEAKDKDRTPNTTKTTVKLKVNDVNRPPVVTNPGDQTLDEKKPFKVQIKATDPDGDTLTYSMTGLPAGATINPTTGEINWTPTDKDVGDHTATITVDDGKGGKTTITVKFTVKNVNDPPTITSTPPANSYVGEDLNYTAKVADPDPNDKHKWTLKQGPPGATIDPVTGKVSWTPDKADVGKKIDFEIEVCDDGTPPLCATQKWQVTVDLKCKVDEDCATDQICVTSSAGPRVCIAPGCANQTPAKCSDATEFCKDSKCGKNPCDGKTCQTGEYCNPHTGNCIKPCAGVTCQTGEKCESGACVKDPCATAGTGGGPCAADEFCDAPSEQTPKCVKNPCGSKSCRHGRVCLDDRCIDDPCLAITCPDPKSQRCVAGQCVGRKDCKVDINCDGEDVCLGGKCYPPACYTASPKCPDPGNICIEAKCQKDECTAGTKQCKENEFCRTVDNTCVASCATIVCKDTEKCENGACVANPCAGKNCAAGEVCLNGNCEKDNCNASNVCRHGRVCSTGKNACADDPCAGVKCPGQSKCVNGQCQPPPSCEFDSQCPGEFLCVGGKCIKPECKVDADCKDGKVCRDGVCKDNPCKDKQCPPGQTCKGGECKGTCSGVFCAKDEVCIDGVCTKDPCAGKQCPPGQVCVNGSCVDDKCAKETTPCKQGRLCNVDKCIDDPCLGLVCPAGNQCKNGQCSGEFPCKTDSECPNGGVCIDGKCAPPACYKDEKCETSKICQKGKCNDNGCTNKNCPAGEFCKPADATCAKTCPTCKEGERCVNGVCEADPCKGKTCAAGERCDNGSCIKDICSEADANTKYCRYGRVCNNNGCLDDPCANVKCATGESCKGGVCVGPPVTPEPVSEATQDEPKPEPVAPEPVTPDAGGSERFFSAAGGLGCLGCTISSIQDAQAGLFFLALFFLLFLGISRRKS